MKEALKLIDDLLATSDSLEEIGGGTIALSKKEGDAISAYALLTVDPEVIEKLSAILES